ncbi:glycosyltransferase family 2 protein [Flavobacterium sp.]|uniref:glycosyltransferase family 2 protein n=1 Tax=Flavobacterium sp. TaxID=239 RepID=UPI003752EA25
MQNNMLVTIICLCYNHDSFVIEALMSVINQSYKNIELIVVDDYSTDNSRVTIENWLKNYPEIQFIANDVNLGNTKSFNNALKIAKGKFIIDLAADDVLLQNAIAMQINGFEKSTYDNLAIVYGNAELITESGCFKSYYFEVDAQKKVIKKRPKGDIYANILSGGVSICSVSAMVKKEVYDILNGYDEDLYYEDLDFWIRASRNYQFDFVDEIIIQKRTVENSLGSLFYKKNDVRSKKINFSTYLILKKTLHLNKTKEENKAVLKRIHFEMILNLKNKNFRLLFRYLILEVKIRLRLF